MELAEVVCFEHLVVCCLAGSRGHAHELHIVLRALLAIKMTVGLTDLLDLAISPQIGLVNFFHLRNLLHTIVEHFGIGEIEAQHAKVRGPQSIRSSSETSSSADSSDSEQDEGWYFQGYVA